MYNYFEVVAKCGHVGRDRYYEGHFFVDCKTAKEAAQFVKSAPRVKSDHKDVILSVEPISKKAFTIGQLKQQNEPYFHCFSKHEQKLYWDEIEEHIKKETDNHMSYIKSTKYASERTKEQKHKKGIRNPYKYAKYNFLDKSLVYDEYGCMIA